MVTIDGVRYVRTDCGKLIRVELADDHAGCIACILAHCQG